MTARFVVRGSKWASSNGAHGHPYTHAALRKDWGRRALAAIVEAGCEPVREPVIITATIYRTSDRRSDASNVWDTVKPCVDAAVRAGIISDDCDDVVADTRIRRGRPNTAAPTVEVVIAPAGCDAAPCQDHPLCECGGAS